MALDSGELRAALVGRLGDAVGPWRSAFAEVPRHAFLPDVVWQQRRGEVGLGGDLHPVRREDDPDAWLRLAYADRAVDTQVDDGHPAADGTGHESTSSASQPAVVADMLVALDAEPGMRVLEIGTGTGFNAALLAHRMGAENVVTVEIDPDVAEQARDALARTGFGKVTVVCADGALGVPEDGPYDRLIATVGVAEVPYPWVEQTVAGGRVVAPLVGTYQSPGIVTLTVREDGTAVGRLGGPAAFMPLRAQRVARPRGRPIDVTTGVESTTDVHPFHVAGNRAAATAIGLRTDGIFKVWTDDPDTAGTGVLWLLDPDTDSWAALTLGENGPPYDVRQDGPRRLWGEVEGAYRWWVEVGERGVGDWTVRVEQHGQRIALA